MTKYQKYLDACDKKNLLAHLLHVWVFLVMNVAELP